MTAGNLDLVRGTLDLIWERIEDHQQQIDRLKYVQKDLVDENAALLRLLGRGGMVTSDLAVQLHKRHFGRMLRRFPIVAPTNIAGALHAPGIALCVARFAGLSNVGRLVATSRCLRGPATAAYYDLSRDVRRPKIYVLGGAHNNEALDTVECFDPASAKWATLPPMPTPRSDLAAAAVGGKLCAIGGYDGRTLSVVEAFDPLTHAWEPLEPMPSPRSDFAAVADGCRLFRCGGLNENYAALDTCQCFDSRTKEWETLAPMRIPRWSFALSAIGGLLYAVGGFADGQALGVVERYCRQSGTGGEGQWQPCAQMPTPRSGLAAAVIDGRIYALGGSCPGRGRALDVVECYDPDADRWTCLAPMLVKRSRFAAAAVGGWIYAVGGFDESGTEALSAVERYDPQTDSWEIVPDRKSVV